MNTVQKDILGIVEKRELFLPLKSSTFFITGATGLIGSMMAKVLIYANKLYDLKIKIVGQIRNKEKAIQIFKDDFIYLELIETDDIECDYIIHTISPTRSKYFIENPVDTIKTSVCSTMSILETAKKNEASMVYLSSMEQYGVPYLTEQFMTEDKIGMIDHLNIRSSYSESKRLCECLCAAYVSQYGINVKIARLAQTFGAGIPLTDNRMPMQFTKAVIEGKDIILHTEGKSVSNFVYLTDALEGILTILEKGEAGQAYNICNDKETRSVREIAELVSSVVAYGKIGVRIEKPENDMGYAPEVKMYLNSDKLSSLGWNAQVDMIEAYRRLVSYLRGE